MRDNVYTPRYACKSRTYVYAWWSNNDVYGYLTCTHINPLEPRGLSDCVLKALLVTEAMLSMSESPRSASMSFSGLIWPLRDLGIL
jgi:tRNA U38,U39,U40 pseudouridine synthase TruA